MQLCLILDNKSLGHLVSHVLYTTHYWLTTYTTEAHLPTYICMFVYPNNMSFKNGVYMMMMTVGKVLETKWLTGLMNVS